LRSCTPRGAWCSLVDSRRERGNQDRVRSACQGEQDRVPLSCRIQSIAGPPMQRLRGLPSRADWHHESQIAPRPPWEAHRPRLNSTPVRCGRAPPSAMLSLAVLNRSQPRLIAMDWVGVVTA
jgi:hypothetical protein